MSETRIALVTGANQGVGFQVAKERVAHGVTVTSGRAVEARRGCCQRDRAGRDRPADRRNRGTSIAAGPRAIRSERGRLDLLVNNAGISEYATQRGVRRGAEQPSFLEEYAKASKASTASLDEMRAVWETNVFGTLAVYQAMLPLLRESSDARIVNVSSGVGSLAANADPTYPYHAMSGPSIPRRRRRTTRSRWR